MSAGRKPGARRQWDGAVVSPAIGNGGRAARSEPDRSSAPRGILRLGTSFTKFQSNVWRGSLIAVLTWSGQRNLLRKRHEHLTASWAHLVCCRDVGQSPPSHSPQAAEIAGREWTETIQLYIEYDPQPPFNSGHMSKASAETQKRAKEMMKRAVPPDQRGSHPRSRGGASSIEFALGASL